MPLRPRKPAAEDTAGVPGPVAPVINNIAFDQPSYNPGQVITATVTYTPGAAVTAQQFTGTATAGGQSGTLTAAFDVLTPQATTVTATDTGNRTWVKKSDTGTVAVFTATA